MVRLFSDRRDISTDLTSTIGRAELNFLGEFECLDYRIVGPSGLLFSNDEATPSDDRMFIGAVVFSS